MNIRNRKIYLLQIVIIFLIPIITIAQLPAWPENNLIYLIGPDNNFRYVIFNFNINQPVQSGINPVQNTIVPPPDAFSLAVSANLNTASPAMTFYTIVDGKYYYYDGSNWVNTNHNAGNAINPGAGGGYIFNFNGATKEMWRYDRTGDATLLSNIGDGPGSIADVSVDCSGNFYILRNQTPQNLRKYSAAGVLLNTYSLNGAPAPPIGGGGGLVVLHDHIYYFSGHDFMHGIISGSVVNFLPPVNFSIDISDCGNYGGTTNRPPPHDINVCPAQLPYNWNGQSYSTPGTFTATFVNVSGCDSIETLNLIVSPQIQGTPVNVSTCINQLPYNWNGQDYLTGGIHTALLTSTFGCDSIATLNLTINPVVAGAPVNASACSNQLPYIWNGNAYTLAGQYTVTLNSNSGCDSIATLNFSILPAVTAFAGSDNTVLYNIPYQLSGSGGQAYEWSPASLLNDAHLQSPVALVTSNTSFYLMVTDAAGCIGYDSVNIKVLEGQGIAVPSAFSPNGDGINDIFRPIGLSKLYYFRIYNRFGKMIFNNSDLFSAGWDGRFMGADQNTGSYMWMLKALDRKGKLREMKGNVLLIR